MILHKVLEVAGDEIKLVDDSVVLGLLNPGRAFFVVQSNVRLSGIVRFSIGYDRQKMQRFFTGFVENSMAIDGQQQKLFCRELTAGLNKRIPLSLRNVTLTQVLDAIAQQTGLVFVVPDQDYATTAVAAFYSVAGGYHCLDSLAKVFNIPQLIWQQQGDGKIFVGSWAHSFWVDKKIPLPTHWQTKHGVANSATLPALPKLRPGVMINENYYVTDVALDGVNSVISWSKNPWI